MANEIHALDARIPRSAVARRRRNPTLRSTGRFPRPTTGQTKKQKSSLSLTFRDAYKNRLLK